MRRVLAQVSNFFTASKTQGTQRSYNRTLTLIVSGSGQIFPPIWHEGKSLKVRVSLVDYLNSAPLGWAFLYGPLKEQFHVLRSTPARCAEQLATGEADIGLIPSIEYQRIPGLQIIPGIAVAALQEVRSVLLVQPREERPIHSVALDNSSRSSAILLKLLLKMKLGRTPLYYERPPDLDEMLRRFDAALIIGDAALKLSADDYKVTDLARAWVEWQHRPFVFAFWACRPTLSFPGNIVELFHRARDWGLQRREEIVQSYSSLLDLPVPFLRGYLDHNIDYNLSGRHLEGLERYFQLAFEAGLITERAPVRFLPTGVQVESQP